MNTPASPELRHWRMVRDDDGILWLGADNADARANVLSREVLGELQAALAAVRASGVRGLVIHSLKDKSFIAGADINEFPRIGSPEEAYTLIRTGQAIIREIEDLPVPSVAVINGNALGGGLELALACSWRIGVRMDEPCIGFPEVLLGLHPGFGGTVRSVRLAGVRGAMDLMLTGRSIRMTRAAAMGLIDEVVGPDDWQAVARRLVGRRAPTRRPPLPDRILSLAPLRRFVAGSLVDRVRSKADRRHFPAPYALIELWLQHAKDPDGGYDAEAKSFAQLVATPTSRNLVRVFFLQERLKKSGGRARQPATHVHVVGAGVMGGDIAAWCAVNGLQVTLQDRELRFIEPALARAEKLFEKRFPAEEARQLARARLRADIAGDGVPGADVVIEAIFENPDAKRDLYRGLEGRMRPDAILATNTSSIPLQELLGALSRPERFIGLHFFNPVARLPLVEVVQTDRCSGEALADALAFTRQIGKLPLPCRSQPGFLVNRILAPYMAEAMELAREGIPLAEIDRAAVDFGMPMGPVELADSVGLDIALHVAEILEHVTGRTPGTELREMVRTGHLGQKTGRGFYIYQDGKAVRPQRSTVPVSAEVQDRLMLALLNEAADCLAEGVVADADLVDAGVIFGTGFAPFRGGPLHYSRERGVDAILDRLRQFCDALGPRFSPSPGWELLRKSG